MGSCVADFLLDSASMNPWPEPGLEGDVKTEESSTLFLLLTLVGATTSKYFLLCQVPESWDRVPLSSYFAYSS